MIIQTKKYLHIDLTSITTIFIPNFFYNNLIILNWWIWTHDFQLVLRGIKKIVLENIFYSYALGGFARQGNVRLRKVDLVVSRVRRPSQTQIWKWPNQNQNECSRSCKNDTNCIWVRFRTMQRHIFKPFVAIVKNKLKGPEMLRFEMKRNFGQKQNTKNGKNTLIRKI